MKIQYEINDRVWIYYGIMSGKVVEIKKQILIVENDQGERYPIHKKNAEPTPRTLENAKHVNF